RELLKLAAAPEMISFAGGLPAPELFPLEQVREAAAHVLQHCGSRALQYGETEGLADLRDWIAARFSSKGLDVRRANVLIVSGGQQALDLIGRVFLDPGDQVVVENPTYLALLSAWRPLGVEFLPVQSDGSGICLDSLTRALEHRPKLVYCVPNFQNPQGTTLAADRRQPIVELARQHETVLVEDNPYGELRYDGESLPHLMEIASQSANVPSSGLYVGTFSKILVPGLRVGWIIGPEPVIDKLVQCKQAADLHTSTFNQYLILELVRSGLLMHHLPKLQQAYRERRDAMLAALHKYFPSGITWTHPAGGMFLMVTLPAHMDARELLAWALKRNVAFVPGEEFHLHHAGRNTFRLNFTNATPARIHEGVRRLGETIGANIA
ncbi:MAG TPA: PLP-dependent aminotransferase family protein, partial [Bacillota bacterium]|nr:PLP-dependent aminotransferase family protein [Bacillota bacterium]